METFLVTASVFIVAFLAMAVGVIISGKTIKGSCGGLSTLFGKGACEVCEKKDRCEKSGKKLKS